MLQRFTAWLPVLLLAAFAGLTFWLDRQVQPSESLPGGKTRHDPDYVVEKVAAIRIGSNGKVRYALSAERMVHYPDDDTTYLEAPKLVSFGLSSETLTVTSKGATLSSNGEDVYLVDDVVLVRSAYGGHSELAVRTSYLHIIPEKNIAQTDKAVQISDANTLITSVGLEFNNETRILKLLSKVRSVYEKPKPAP